MSQAIISRRGGGYATVKFENYGDVQTVEKGTSTNLVVGRTAPAATTVGNFALFGGGRDASSEQSTCGRLQQQFKSKYSDKFE